MSEPIPATMHVHELISLLEQCYPNAVVVLARDGEGNGFSPCAEVTSGRYLPVTNWVGEYSETDGNPAVCLWPRR
jgi:hypothetical protein